MGFKVGDVVRIPGLPRAAPGVVVDKMVVASIGPSCVTFKLLPEDVERVKAARALG